MTTPTFSVEVITLPVSDVDRAMRFYVDSVGFTLDDDYAPTEAFRVVQLLGSPTSPPDRLATRISSDPDGNSWILQERGYRAA